MKQNKGFTLIELLAVLVILAVIALITTPVVLSAISTAKTNANKESARGYVDALQYYCAKTMLDSPTQTLPTYAAAKLAIATVTKNSASVAVLADSGHAFDANCKVTGTGTFNGYDLTALGF